MLLAISLSQKIPPCFIHGDVIPAALVIVDQYGNEHSAEIGLEVDRSATMKLSSTRPTRSSLFDPVKTDPPGPTRGQALYGPAGSDAREATHEQAPARSTTDVCAGTGESETSRPEAQPNE
jgi:hypothetical protein